MLDDLVAMLNDPDHRVRCSTLHSLGCDRCKQGSCRPEEAKVLPRAIAFLADDPHPHVRAHAIGPVGRWVHSNPDAEAALLGAMRSDSSPAVRKKAGWCIPGRSTHRRTLPKVRRRLVGSTPQLRINAFGRDLSWTALFGPDTTGLRVAKPGPTGYEYAATGRRFRPWWRSFPRCGPAARS